MRTSSKRRSWNSTGQRRGRAVAGHVLAITWIFGFAGASRWIAKSAMRRPCFGLSALPPLPGAGKPGKNVPATSTPSRVTASESE